MNTTQPRPRDLLEVFGNIRLLPDVRRDNGYSGPHCDPYGRLGDSRRGVVAPSTVNRSANSRSVGNRAGEKPRTR